MGVIYAVRHYRPPFEPLQVEMIARNLKPVMDDIDRRLLGLLMANARRSTMSLAKQLGLARTTVHERIERLQRSGTIIGYTALLNRNWSDGFVQAIVLLAISQKSQKPILARVEALPEVKMCLTINGEFDLLLMIEAPQNEDLDATIDEINSISGVERSKSLVVLSTKIDRRAPVST